MTQDANSGCERAINMVTYERMKKIWGLFWLNFWLGFHFSILFSLLTLFTFKWSTAPSWAYLCWENVPCAATSLLGVFRVVKEIKVNLFWVIVFLLTRLPQAFHISFVRHSGRFAKNSPHSSLLRPEFPWKEFVTEEALTPFHHPK